MVVLARMRKCFTQALIAVCVVPVAKGFNSCAECPDDSYTILEKAQSVLDEVPNLIDDLKLADFDINKRSSRHSLIYRQGLGQISREVGIVAPHYAHMIGE